MCIRYQSCQSSQEQLLDLIIVAESSSILLSDLRLNKRNVGNFVFHISI